MGRDAWGDCPSNVMEFVCEGAPGARCCGCGNVLPPFKRIPQSVAFSGVVVGR